MGRAGRTGDRQGTGDSRPDLWIFGYGSLMWRPEVPHLECVAARLKGYHRAFCVASTHHRGTETRPGLVLGLDCGGSCIGMAFRIPEAHRAGTLAYLRARELIYGVYREAHLEATLIEPAHRRVTVIAYVVERAHPSYAGRLPLAAQARMIRAARGISGANLDYLINTVAHLAGLGIREPALERVVALAAGPARRGLAAGDNPARPAVEALARAWTRHALPARPLTLDQRRRFQYRQRLGGA
jgi:cation transport protein ChaC